MLLLLPFRVYGKESKGKYIRAGGKFLHVGEKARKLLTWQLSSANETTVNCK